MPSDGSHGWSDAVGLFKYFFTLIICSQFEDLCLPNTEVLGQQGVICWPFKDYRLRSQISCRKMVLFYFTLFFTVYLAVNMSPNKC
jgi:hypothetical protein